MIRLDRLSKSFGARPALHDLTLEIPKGQIFGLLGHNGAGKSTTFGMILGQVFPSGGAAYIRDVSVQAHRLRALQGVGAIFETPAFYDYLSGWTNLRILTSYTRRLPKGELMETVKFVGLEERIHDPVRVYSHGMRQRLALAQALLPRPELVLLDEPAEGLDPEGIHEMRHLILRLNRERGMTVLLSSHLLSEVEQMCDRIAVLNKGRMIFEGKWTELAGDALRYRLDIDPWEKGAAVIAEFPGAVLSENILMIPPGSDIAGIVARLVHAGIQVRAVEPVKQSLEEIYLTLVSAPA
ncbi:MAG TPA: ABC transporter ATP-binding protein [Chthoniobacteraceae bacterium]|nr:ABC transporter ATP-binding protein [Chthoniobacteraceae bacterium]